MGINKNDYEELLDPKMDFCFKEIFGHNEFNFINFANAILSLKEDKKIKHVDFLNLEMSKDLKENKDSRLDVLAKLNDGSLVNIEIQCANYKDFEQRSLYYFSKIYGSQLKKKKTFHELKPVVIINILDFVIFDDDDDFHSPLIIANAKNYIRRCKDFEMHFLELPKLKKTCYDKTNPLEKWMLFFKEPLKDNLKELAMQDSEIAKAFESLEILSHDPKARAVYEARKRSLLDISNGMYVNRLEGKAEGLVEGLTRGLAEGKLAGETRKALEIAKKMKEKKRPFSEIMDFTGLTKEVIEKA